jgi:hypothetical protein
MIAVEADYEGMSGGLGVITEFLAEDSLAASLTASISPDTQAFSEASPPTCQVARSFPSWPQRRTHPLDLIIHSLVVLLSGRVPEA